MFLDSSARPRRRSGCLAWFLLTLGLLFGLTTGSVLPPTWRGWIASRLPVALASFGQSTPSLAPPPTPSPAAPTPVPTPVATATPLPKVPVIPPKALNTARLFNGIQVHSTFEAEPGRQAALERETPASYALDIQLQIKIPTAARAVEELTHSAPSLLTTFPKMNALLEKAEVSKFYFGLYQNKTEQLRQNLTRLDALLSRDTFYDTDTILELQDSGTHRRVLLIQSDMDVDSDGSDADRLLEVDSTDPNFQPLTSYRWLRRTSALNPLLDVYRDRLTRVETELRTPPAASPRRNLQGSLETLRTEVYQLEHYSSLVARTDPFIVLPGFMVRQSGHPYQPKLGDYAVVLANDHLYPAIFGDIGPGDRAGEASLRLAQAVDPRATPERSPVNDLKITYLVFPGSADQPAAPPDLGQIRQRCQALLNEIGGSRLELHEWANLIPPPTPPPTPVPSIAPAASPQAGVASPAPPAATPSPTALPPVTPFKAPPSPTPVFPVGTSVPKPVNSPLGKPLSAGTPKPGNVSAPPSVTPSPSASPLR